MRPGKYVGLVKIVAEKYHREMGATFADILNEESLIKYRENKKNYAPMNISYYLLAIGHTMKRYEWEDRGVHRY